MPVSLSCERRGNITTFEFIEPKPLIKPGIFLEIAKETVWSALSDCEGIVPYYVDDPIVDEEIYLRHLVSIFLIIFPYYIRRHYSSIACSACIV